MLKDKQEILTMKNLIFINGTMGAGKTVTGRELQKLLQDCVFLDGDWCWDSRPLIVNRETKDMVIGNITYMLRSFLACDAYKNIVFCWVMHEEAIIDAILKELEGVEYCLHIYTLICREDVLKTRIMKDVEAGIREPDVLMRSIARLNAYDNMNTIRIDVNEMTAKQTAEWIRSTI